MNEEQLKKAEEALKAQKADFKKHVEETEKGLEEKAKARDEEFEKRLTETRGELEKEAARAAKGITGNKGCYKDSSYWKAKKEAQRLADSEKSLERKRK